MNRRRVACKALLLALTAIAACCLPLLSLKAFLYLCGGVTAAVGLVLAGMVLDLYVGFRIFESRLDAMARRAFGRKPFMKLVRR